MKKVLIITSLLITLSSCTENIRARNFGGNETIALEKNEILMNATWKETDLWVLVKDTTTNEIYFREHSTYGIWEGQITFK